MYDLQWHLKVNPLVVPGILDKYEEEKYKKLLLDAICYIDNDIICEQKNIRNDYKIAILLCKEENKEKKKIEMGSDDIKIFIGDFFSASATDYAVIFE